MKKWVFVPVLLIIAGVWYFLVPSRRTISKIVGSKCSIAAATRYFADTSKWADWWPQGGGGPSRSGAAFVYGDYAYTITNIYYNQVRFSIHHAGDSIYGGSMQMVQVSADSLLVGIECVSFPGNDPLRRLSAHSRQKELQENIAGVLNAFKTFAENKKNIYGIDIVHTMSTDSILMTLSGVTPEYPTTAYIYTLIDSVRKYVQAEGALVHNPPLLNVSRNTDGRYRTMVAFSINKRLSGTPTILTKRFVPWKMIEGKVYGGPHKADAAIYELFRFRDDHHLDIMSIPFEFLDTDRRSQPDTTKWLTRVCAPIS